MEQNRNVNSAFSDEKICSKSETDRIVPPQDNCTLKVNSKSERHSDLETEGSLHINIDRLKVKSIKVPISVGGETCVAVIDTGAEVSVLNNTIYEQIPEDKRPKLLQAKRKLVVAEAGKEMSVCGIIDIDIEVGGFSFKWPVYVAPIRDDLLLGWDMIYHHKFAIDPEKGFRVKDKWLEMQVNSPKRQVMSVEVNRAVTIPAKSEFVLSCQCPDSAEGDYLFEPVVINRLIGAKSVVTPHKNRVPVRLINPSNVPTKIPKKTVIGYLQEADDVQSTGCRIINSEMMDIPVYRLREDNSCVVKTEEICSVDHPSKNVAEPKMPEVVLESIAEEDEHGQESDPYLHTVPEHLRGLYQNSLTNLKTNDEKRQLAEMLIEHQNTFAKTPTDLGRCSVLKHKIDVAGAAPIRQPMRRTPQGFEEEEEKYLKDQLEAGVIRPSNSPWSSPTVLVRKKDGGVRWCIDYRRVNDVTVKDAYPLPRIDSCLDQLSSAKLFSTLDLQSGYWQLELEEESKPITAFISKYGLYEYNTLPFGLCGAPSTFQRAMELIGRGLQWEAILIYLDDIIVLGANFDEQLSRLKEVLTRLANSGLKLKASKCELFKSEVLFLGHVVGQDGIRPNPKLVESIQNWQEPTCVKGIQKFVGLCNYYRQYILNFSERAAPLTQLTKKNVPFQWNNKAQCAFDDLKGALCDSTVLAYPRDNSMFILDTDASDVGVGSVLSQVQDGKERVVAYASKKLNSAQQRYSVTRRELLAVVTFTHHFRHYLLGRKFLLRTDHGSLRWLFNFKDPRGQVARWLEALSQYSFDIQHRPGRNHQNADSLSRKDYEGSDCAHNATDAETCLDCWQTKEDWKEFTEEVDNVVDLGVQLDTELNCRAVTRQQMQKEEAEQTDNQKSQERPTEVTYLPNYSAKDIGILQREDSDLGKLHEWLDKGKIPTRDEVNGLSPAVRKHWLNWDNIVKKGHVIYQRFILGDKRENFQLLVPKVLRKTVLKMCHDDVFAGHPGVNRTLERVRRDFYWYRYKEDIRLHVSMCQVCSRTTQPVKVPRAPLQHYRAGYPLDRIGIDVMGPLKETKNGNKYVLVIGDYFTRWMEAYSLPNQKTEEVASKLVFEFICRYGIPFELHSDQGSNFQSELFQEVCSLLSIKKTRCTPYRPSSNGLIERFNSTLGRMLKKFVDRNSDDWDQYIGLLMAAYRSTKHPSTGYSPNEMMLGRQVTLPVDVMFPLPKSDNAQEPSDYVYNLRQKMEECYELARKQLKVAASRQKRDYDSRIKEYEYKPSDLVYKRHPSPKKMERPWDGPFVVVKMVSPSVYLIQGKRKTTVVHHDRLKPCNMAQEDLPVWVKKVVHNLNRN